MTAGDAQRAMLALPLAGLHTILGEADPLVLAPHADDESLGCGGLLAACVAAGRRPAVLVLTDGTGSHPSSREYPADRLRDVRECETLDAGRILGVASDRIGFLRLPDTALPVHGPAFEAAVRAVAGALTRLGCSTLLSPWQHDPHCDHEAAHLIAAETARRTGTKLLSYPVWGWTLPADSVLEGPAPAGWRFDITSHLMDKQRAIRAHRSQYGGLVTDDPAGFTLPAHLLSHFARPFETFMSHP